MIESPPQPVDGESFCDGIHDDGAPAHHLCTWCFPDAFDRWDLVDGFDEDDESQCEEEME